MTAELRAGRVDIMKESSHVSLKDQLQILRSHFLIDCQRQRFISDLAVWNWIFLRLGS